MKKCIWNFIQLFTLTCNPSNRHVSNRSALGNETRYVLVSVEKGFYHDILCLTLCWVCRCAARKPATRSAIPYGHWIRYIWQALCDATLPPPHCPPHVCIIGVLAKNVAWLTHHNYSLPHIRLQYYPVKQTCKDTKQPMEPFWSHWRDEAIYHIKQESIRCTEQSSTSIPTSSSATISIQCLIIKSITTLNILIERGSPYVKPRYP